MTARVPALHGLPDDLDGVHLIQSLERFDVLAQSPHFPGYPLAVGLVRCLPASGGRAWALAGSVAACLAAVLLGLLVRLRVSPRAGFGAAVATAFLPLAAIESVRVATDSLALPFLFASLLLLDRNRAFTGGLVWGLGLGIRPSAFPWSAALLFGGQRRRAVAGAAVGSLLWLLPTLALTGPGPYVREGVRFVRGHFATWGKPLITSTDGFLGRVASNWVVGPLTPPALSSGLSATCLVVLAAGGVLLLRRVRRQQTVGMGPAFAAGSCYAGWLLVAQNPSHSRHVLPLGVLLVGLAVAGLLAPADTAPAGRSKAGPRRQRLRIRHAAAVCLLTGYVGSTLWALRGYRDQRPPQFEVAMRTAQQEDHDPARDCLYAGDDLELYAWIIPYAEVRPAHSLAQVRADLMSRPQLPARLWITSSAILPEDPLEVPPRFEIRRPPWLFPRAARIRVYSLTPAQLLAPDRSR